MSSITLTTTCLSGKIYLPSNKPKAIVTGGAGFVGSHIVDRLIKDGFHVRIIDNLSSGKVENINPRAEFINMDIRHLQPIWFVGFDYVFHEAALAKVQQSIDHPEETNDVNVNGTLRVLECAKTAGVKKVIYAASSSAYGDNKLPLREDYPAKPQSPYAVQKLTGEYYCKVFNDVYKLPTVSLRYFNVYGSRVDASNPYAGVLTIFKKRMANGESLIIYGDGKQSRDFTYIDDVVEANIKAMTAKTNGEVINIGRNENHNLLEIAKMLGAKQIEFREARQGDIKHTIADITKAKEILKWKPKVSLKNGLKLF